MTAVLPSKRMDDMQWPRVVNRVITSRWVQLKNSLVLKDFIDYLIQKRVVSLDYWMGLKSKPISESERTEDFLAMVMKFDQQKYNLFLEALLSIQRHDLVADLLATAKAKPKKPKELAPDEKSSPAKEKRNTKDKLRSTSTEPVSKTYNYPSNAERNTSSLSGERSKPEAISVSGRKPTASPTKWLTEVKPRPNEYSNKVNSKSEKETTNTKQGTTILPSKPTVVEKTVAVEQQAKVTERLYQGIPSNEDIAGKNGSGDNKSGIKAKKTVEFQDKNEKDTDEKQPRPGTSKSREEILEEREQLLKSKEDKLIEKEKALKEKEKSLSEKEFDLVSRENTFTNSTLRNPQSQLKEMELNFISPDVSLTQTSEILHDVREQLKAMRKVKEEIESEHTTCCNTPKDEFVKLDEFQNLQHDIEELKDEIYGDRRAKEVIQHKVEDLKSEVDMLHGTIEKLKTENEKRNEEFEKEIARLKTELKHTGHDNDVIMKKIEAELRVKQEENLKTKAFMEDLTEHSKELEKRVEILEHDKQVYEAELQRYEKEVSDLRQNVEAKETDLGDLRNVLEETENEKEDLIDMLNNLKSEVDKLKSDKKKLEADKKVLLARCVKPQWNQSPGGSIRRASFK
ncbi:hypothetical protein MAR_012465 [Mya arenaria]|uniref:CARD domain-containing protein n=1 Tax=Mya arenaria TaxID=6604 RepID=A0ABY7G117_MYAAR|nr:uncharacterized protein LOC128216980 [Mya arenaria]WAR26761.1 hypothetical protein MAR_012465 [Mya arenaria]